MCIRDSHQIEEVVGDRVLQSSDLITGYCIITKRMDTGSPWIISNNPRAPYWESKTGDIGNKDYPLVNLVRASTAAPHFFDPELLPISQNKELPVSYTHLDVYKRQIWMASGRAAAMRSAIRRRLGNASRRPG